MMGVEGIGGEGGEGWVVLVGVEGGGTNSGRGLIFLLISFLQTRCLGVEVTLCDEKNSEYWHKMYMYIVLRILAMCLYTCDSDSIIA